MGEQLQLDTGTADISSAYVQSGKVGSPGHIKAAGKDASDTTSASTPVTFTLAELDDVFDKLGHGQMDAATRSALVKRAADIIKSLRDNNEAPLDSEEAQWWLEQADFSDDQRKDLAAKGQALPDGSFPIRNVSDLRNAIKAFGRGKNKASAKRHIIKRAKALGKANLIPDNWSGGAATAEYTGMIQPFLVLTKEGEREVIIQEAPSATNNGIMKLRVPFYVGNSIAYAKGIDRPLRFGLEKLDGIIARGNARIAESKQPITVYARHAHASSADKLPVGKVVGLERQGGIGYAIEEIAPTTDGRDVQTLARNKMLNAVSLRAGADSYSLEDITINGEEAFDVDLDLDGIDFAPDGPAQPTYGIEVLAAEARVEPVVSQPKRSERVLEEITLEAVRGKTEIVQALEAPLKAEIAKLTQERDEARTALAEKDVKLAEIERDAHIKELAGQFPDPEKALGIIQDLCKDVKTKEGIDSKVMPLLLDALKQKPKETPEAPKPPENPFLAMFPTPSATGAGSVLGLEALDRRKEDGEVVTGLAVPA
jgi:hypothetical protein